MQTAVNPKRCDFAAVLQQIFTCCKQQKYFLKPCGPLLLSFTTQHMALSAPENCCKWPLMLHQGYRKSFNSQRALVSLIKRQRKPLDNKGYGGTVLLNLYTGSDTLNHGLLIAYGFDIKK